MNSTGSWQSDYNLHAHIAWNHDMSLHVFIYADNNEFKLVSMRECLYVFKYIVIIFVNAAVTQVHSNSHTMFILV